MNQACACGDDCVSCEDCNYPFCECVCYSSEEFDDQEKDPDEEDMDQW